jgi:hypothetical protein
VQDDQSQHQEDAGMGVTGPLALLLRQPLDQPVFRFSRTFGDTSH